MNAHFTKIIDPLEITLKPIAMQSKATVILPQPGKQGKINRTVTVFFLQAQLVIKSFIGILHQSYKSTCTVAYFIKAKLKQIIGISPGRTHQPFALKGIGIVNVYGVYKLVFVSFKF